MGGSFLVSLSGQIQWIDLNAVCGNYLCDYEILTGPSWKLLNGSATGTSQIVTTSFTSNKLVVNFPIEAIYKSSNPFGWPQIIISVYCGNNLQGFGRIHAPVQAGVHTLNSVLLKPIPITVWDRIAQFLGYTPNFYSNPAPLVTPNMIKTESFGNMQIMLNILMQNFQASGYDYGTKKQQHF